MGHPHIGLPQEMINERGQVYWRADYDAQGNVENESGVIGNPLRFQGQFFDKETGLCYNRHRYYDPDRSRFVSLDPLGLAAGENLYAYAPNVWNWVDPLGLTCKKDGTKSSFKEGKTFYRNMSKSEAEAVKKTGKLRGGNPGETFFTDSHFKSGTKAQDRLSLPQRPEVQMEFQIKNNPVPVSNGTRVTPSYGGRGKGREFMTTNPVEVKIINIQPY